MPRFRLTLILVATTVTAYGASDEAEENPAVRLAVVAKAQAEASARYRDGLTSGKTPEAKQTAVDQFLGEVHKNAEAALELARANPGDPVAVEALKFVVRTARAGPGDESYRAIEILARDHARAAGMGEFCGQIFYFFQSPAAETLIRAVLKDHPNRTERGYACHSLAQYLKNQAKMARRLRKSPEEIKNYEISRGKQEVTRFLATADPEALEKGAEGLLERVIAEFCDVRHPAVKATYGELAAGELFAMRNLAVGKVAPEVEGKDHTGATFRLSEYRGKVVVLTFSGDWCGPCVAMYPQERELVSRLKDKPFALVSVSTDKTSETLSKAIDGGKLTWRCWWDGGTDGPITTGWGVSAFPSIFVLDKAGVIRFKDVRGPDLDRAVESLLE